METREEAESWSEGRWRWHAAVTRGPGTTVGVSPQRCLKTGLQTLRREGLEKERVRMRGFQDPELAKTLTDSTYQSAQGRRKRK